MQEPMVCDYPNMDEYNAALYLFRERKLAEWQKLPPLQRIETWREAAGGLIVAHAMRLLGDALSDWAKEQRAKEGEK